MCGGGDEGVTDLISCPLSCSLNGVLIGRGCVNRQLAEECLYKGTHGETVLEMRPSLFTTSAPKLKKKSWRENEKKKEDKGMDGAGRVGGGQSCNNRVEWSGNRQNRKRGRKRDRASRWEIEGNHRRLSSCDGGRAARISRLTWGGRSQTSQ